MAKDSAEGSEGISNVKDLIARFEKLSKDEQHRVLLQIGRANQSPPDEGYIDTKGLSKDAQAMLIALFELPRDAWTDFLEQERNVELSEDAGAEIVGRTAEAIAQEVHEVVHLPVPVAAPPPRSEDVGEEIPEGVPAYVVEDLIRGVHSVPPEEAQKYAARFLEVAASREVRGTWDFLSLGTDAERQKRTEAEQQFHVEFARALEAFAPQHHRRAIKVPLFKSHREVLKERSGFNEAIFWQFMTVLARKRLIREKHSTRVAGEVADVLRFLERRGDIQLEDRGVNLVKELRRFVFKNSGIPPSSLFAFHTVVLLPAASRILTINPSPSRRSWDDPLEEHRLEKQARKHLQAMEQPEFDRLLAEARGGRSQDQGGGASRRPAGDAEEIPPFSTPSPSRGSSGGAERSLHGRLITASPWKVSDDRAKGVAGHLRALRRGGGGFGAAIARNLLGAEPSPPPETPESGAAEAKPAERKPEAGAEETTPQKKTTEMPAEGTTVKVEKPEVKKAEEGEGAGEAKKEKK